MVTLESVLAEIAAGKKSFAPASKSNSDIEAFQELAKVLEYANAQGFLDGYSSHKESYTGHRWYVLAMVPNGLSYQGEHCLQLPPKAPESLREEIIELKPNFHGVGINLKALWRWLRR